MGISNQKILKLLATTSLSALLAAAPVGVGISFGPVGDSTESGENPLAFRLSLFEHQALASGDDDDEAAVDYEALDESKT